MKEKSPTATATTSTTTSGSLPVVQAFRETGKEAIDPTIAVSTDVEYIHRGYIGYIEEDGHVHDDPVVVLRNHRFDVMELGDWIPEEEMNFPLPRFISVTLSKQPTTVETPIGITLSNPTGETLIISDIQGSSWIGRSPLKSGCIVHSINGTSASQLTSLEADDIIERSVDVDPIHILAEDPNGDPLHAIAMVSKPTPDARSGLRFSSREGLLVLRSISSHGVFADSVLNQDDQVIAINYIRCEQMQVVEAVEIIQRQSESMTILVRHDPNTGFVLSQSGGDFRYATREYPPLEIIQERIGQRRRWACLRRDEGLSYMVDCNF